MDHAEIHRAGLSAVGTDLREDLCGRPVLVVRAPGRSDPQLRALREFLVESLALGVLVLGQNDTISLERFPQLGGVCCCQEELPGEGEGEPPEGQEPLLREHAGFQPVINGRNAQEKQAILKQLKAYRKAHGLGCLEEVAREAGAAVTSGLLRDMLIGAASPGIAQWRQVGKALDKLTASGEEGGGE